MECEGFALRTRTSANGFINFFFPIYSKPISSLSLLSKPRKCRSSKSLFCAHRLQCVSYAALNIAETSSSDCFLDKHSPSDKQLDEGFRKKPKNSWSPNRPHFLPSEGGIQSVVGNAVSWKHKEWLKRYSGMLRECASKGCVRKAKVIHGVFMRSEFEMDSHLWVSLINAYSKCGSLENARRVLDMMPEQDVVSWTALISGFVAEGCGIDGIRLYSEMRKEDLLPNEFTLASCLKSCSLCVNLEFGKQVHAETIKVGHFSDLFVGSALVNLYAKCGEVELADKVFFSMPEQNAVSWNSLLNGYAEVGDGKEVLNLFLRMTESEMKFNIFTLSTVLKGCSNSGYLKEGQIVHSMAVKIGCEFDEFLSCSLVDFYSKCGLADDALKVFMRIKAPDVVVWSAMISCLQQQGRSEEAIGLFHRMRHAGVRPNQFTLASLLSAGGDHSNLQFGRSIHAFICKYRFESEISVNNALVAMYMKNGCLQDGAQVFKKMKDQDIVSWNALLSGFHDSENGEQGLSIFHQMLVNGFQPNMYTFISVLRCCSSLSNVSFGKQVHAHSVKNNLSDNDFVGTALLDMYAKNNSLRDAQLAFISLIKRDIFSWTVIITSYAQTDQGEKAFNYLRQMQREGVKPNEFTLAGCLSGCSRVATLESGRQLHSISMKAGYLNDAFVSTSLVDMYGKCGCLEDAESAFKDLVSRDTVSWNTMICGYSQHGQGEKTLEAFNLMLKDGNAPDEITFIGILSACSCTGLVEEGKMYFNSMTNVYKITPIIEHYACMVDILGRAGKFDEVESFIKEMKLGPYSLIWESVLGSCRLHGNVELAEKAAQKLFGLQPMMDSNYVLLSNIFAAKGRWDDVRKVRELMTSQGIKKEPGCSWVEVDGHVHVFTSRDHSHPMSKEIETNLKELMQGLTSMGYKPKTEQVLHNIGETEKMEHLYHHSERLALVFALMNTKSQKTIRIFKNLRICVDCHDVMKLISDKTNRGIVVRDISRFHHFKNGTCSCQDYW